VNAKAGCVCEAGAAATIGRLAIAPDRNAIRVDAFAAAGAVL
jgi:hypothetical protein